jgi:hypothetical protein
MGCECCLWGSLTLEVSQRGKCFGLHSLRQNVDSERYPNYGAFLTDARLVFSNAILYNRAGTVGTSCFVTAQGVDVRCVSFFRHVACFRSILSFKQYLWQFTRQPVR